MSRTNFNFGWNQVQDNASPWNGKRGQEQEPVKNKHLDKSPWMHDSVCSCKECQRINIFADRVKREIRALTQSVRKVNNIMSPSAADILRNGGGGKGTLLHGTDVPKKTASFTIEILAFREAPEGFKSLGIVDIKPVFDCTAWALNKTNFKALMNKFGDNTDKWKGKVKLQVIQVRNPSNGTTGPSLAVAQ